MYSFSQWLSKILYAIALHFIHVYNILRWRIQCFLEKSNFFTWPVKKYRSQFRLPNLHTGKYLGIFPKDNNHGAMTCVQGIQVQKNHVAPRLTQLFILLGVIRWVPGTPGNLVIESKLSLRSSSEALKGLKTIQSGAIKLFLKKSSLRKLYKLRVLRTVQRYLTLKKSKLFFTLPYEQTI